MPSLTDVKFEALRAKGYTGAMSDMILQWLKANGAPTANTVSDAWYAMLVSKGYTGQVNDGWFALLGSLGYTGNINDRELQFWVAGGNFTLLVDLLITDDGDFITTDDGDFIEAG